MRSREDGCPACRQAALEKWKAARQRGEEREMPLVIPGRDGEAMGNRTMCGGGGKHKKGDVARSEKNNEVSTGRGAR